MWQWERQLIIYENWFSQLTWDNSEIWPVEYKWDINYEQKLFKRVIANMREKMERIHSYIS